MKIFKLEKRYYEKTKKKKMKKEELAKVKCFMKLKKH